MGCFNFELLRFLFGLFNHEINSPLADFFLNLFNVIVKSGILIAFCSLIESLIHHITINRI